MGTAYAAGLLAGLGGGGDWGRFGAIEHGVRATGALIEDNQAEGSAHEDDGGPGGEPGKDVGRGAGSEGGLRALTAEGACEIGRAALLQQDDADQKEAHNDVEDDNENQNNLHFPICFRSVPLPGTEETLVRRRGLPSIR
jgi:hypothetical protein